MGGLKFQKLTTDSCCRYQLDIASVRGGCDPFYCASKLIADESPVLGMVDGHCTCGLL